MWPQKDNFEAQRTGAQPYRKREAPIATGAAGRAGLTPSKSLAGSMRLPKLATSSQQPGAVPSSATVNMTTPSSARKRTFDALVATDTPPQSPSRAFSTLPNHIGSPAAGATAANHDLADAYRPTLYAAFLANVFADSTNTAAQGKKGEISAASGKRSPTGSGGASSSASYTQLIAQLRLSTHSRPSGSASLSQLGQWLSALTHHVSKLDHRSHAELVEAILAIPWPTLGPAISRAWTTFVCSLLSARTEWLGAVLEHAVCALGYHSEWHELPLAAAPSYAARQATRRSVYTRVHALLRSLLSLIPTLPTTLFPLLLAHLPPKRAPLRTQGLYILNLLRVTEYAPELTEGIWAAVVHRVMSIDVEVQMEVEDLEDDAGRLDFLDGPSHDEGEEQHQQQQHHQRGGGLATGLMVDILDRPLVDEDADDVDADSDLDPTDAIGDDILNDPGAYDGSGSGGGGGAGAGGAGTDDEDATALDELSSGDDSSDSEAADRHGPPKSAAQRRADEMLRQQEAVRSIKKNVKKLDVVMQILYEYLRRANASFMGLGPAVSGYFEEGATASLSSSSSSRTLVGGKGMKDSKERERGGSGDEDLLMAAGEMEEDGDVLGNDSHAFTPGGKVRRVESPTASLPSAAGPNGRARRSPIPLFEPTPSPSPGPGPAPANGAGALVTPLGPSLAPAQPQRRTNLFYILLGIFDRLVLPTFRSRHVQFVMFWFSSLDAEYADTFLGMLLSKSLYSGPAAAAAAAASASSRGGAAASASALHHGGHGASLDELLYESDPAAFGHGHGPGRAGGGGGGGGARHEASSPILRKAAASYVASLVSRASFIGTAHTRAVVLNLCAFLDAYLEQYALACAHAAASAPGGGLGVGLDGMDASMSMSGLSGVLGPPPPGSAVHDVFYSIAQALFYIFCFRWRDLELVDGAGGAEDDQAGPARAPPPSSAGVNKRSGGGGNSSRSASGRPTGMEPSSVSSSASSGPSSSSLGSVAAHYKTTGFGVPGSSLAAFSSHAPSSLSSTSTSSGRDRPASSSSFAPHSLDSGPTDPLSQGGGDGGDDVIVGGGGGGGGPSASFHASSRTWCDGLEVVQRVITSSLNPLRYCSPTVVRQFAYVAKVTGLVYCYSIIEANNRVIGSIGSGPGPAAANSKVSMTASGTLQPLSAADRALQQARGRGGRQDTPTGRRADPRSGSDEGSDDGEDTSDDDDDDDGLPQPAGSERLDGFFPFDPYRLQNSMGFVEGLYRQWEDVAPEANDEDEDDDSSRSSSSSSSSSSSGASEAGSDDDSSDESSDEDETSDDDDDAGDDDVSMSGRPSRAEPTSAQPHARRRRGASRQKLSPSSAAMQIPRRDGVDAGGAEAAAGERERFAQSFEAMSLSPNP